MGDVVGRASNRKKTNRQAARSIRKARQSSGTDAARQEAILKVAATFKAFAQEAARRKEREAAACRTWCGGAEPVPAEAPQWPDGSLGDRFFTSTSMAEARTAPCLLTAEIPDVAAIAADPAHWNVAANALIRAVAFDGLKIDHPAVSGLLEVLAPIAEAELVYRKAADAWPEWADDEPEFPALDGPVFLLGACALMDAVWAIVGEDPLTEILRVLLPVLKDAVPGLDAQAIADALISAFADEYRCELPGDAEVLQRIRHHGGDALQILVTSAAVPAAEVLPAGLTVLSVLAEFCQSSSVSALHRAA